VRAVPQIRKILVGYDFTGPAHVALEHALGLAKQSSAEVLVVVAGHWNDTFRGMPVPNSPARFAKLLDSMPDEEQAAYRALRDLYASITIDVLVVDDDAGTGLAESAQHLKADLLVTGTHGRSGLPRFVEGSIAEDVIKHAACPVMVARGALESIGGYKRILVPTDFSPESAHALSFAASLRPGDGEVEVVHYWSSGLSPGASKMGESGSPNEPDPEWWSAREAIYARGKAFIAECAVPEAKLHFVVHEMDARVGLVASFERREHDLVVMGTASRRGLRRLLGGSLAETAAREATCPVVVVHAPLESA